MYVSGLFLWLTKKNTLLSTNPLALPGKTDISKLEGMTSILQCYRSQTVQAWRTRLWRNSKGVRRMLQLRSWVQASARCSKVHAEPGNPVPHLYGLKSLMASPKKCSYSVQTSVSTVLLNSDYYSTRNYKSRKHSGMMYFVTVLDQKCLG